MGRLLGCVAWLAHGIALAPTAALCALLVPLVVAALAESSAQQALAPETWKSALASSGVYERLPAVAAAQATRQAEIARKQSVGDAAEPGGPPPAFRDLTVAQLEAIVREVLPPEWLRSQTERALDLLLADPTPTGPITISLAELKTHLASGSAARAYVALVRAQRPCTADEAAAWGSRVELPSCRPPDDALERSVPSIASALAAAARDLPDEVDVRQGLMTDAEREAARAAEQSVPATPGDSGLDQMRRTLRTAMALPFAAAGIVVLLAVRSRRALLGWLGTPMVFGGLIALAVALEIGPLAERGSAILAAKVPVAFSPVLVASGLDVARAVVDRVASSMALAAGAVTLAGIATLLIAPLASRRRLAVRAPPIEPAAAPVAP